MNRFRRHGNEDFEEIELPIHIIAEISDSVTGYNLFAYCDNDPVNKADVSGNYAEVNEALLNEQFWEMLKDVCAALTVITVSASTLEIIATVAIIVAVIAVIGEVVYTSSKTAEKTSPVAIEMPKTSVSTNMCSGGGNIPINDGSEIDGGNSSKVTSNLGNEIDITPSSNHTTTTKNPGLKGTPNLSIDILDSNGNIKTRRWFGLDGTQIRDVDFTNHGNAKVHPEWPHVHRPR